MLTATNTAAVSAPFAQLEQLSPTSATFTKLFDWLEDLPDYTPALRRVFAAMIRLGGRAGVTCARRETIAQAAHCCVRSVSSAFRLMERDGFLSITVWHTHENGQVKRHHAYHLAPAVVRIAWLPLPQSSCAGAHGAPHARGRIAANFADIRDGIIVGTHVMSSPRVGANDDAISLESEIPISGPLVPEALALARDIVDLRNQLADAGRVKPIRFREDYARKLAQTDDLATLERKLQEHRAELARPLPAPSATLDAQARALLRVGEYVPPAPEAEPVSPPPRPEDLPPPPPEARAEARAAVAQLLEQVAADPSHTKPLPLWSRNASRLLMQFLGLFLRNAGAPVNADARVPWETLFRTELTVELARRKAPAPSAGKVLGFRPRSGEPPEPPPDP